jgi:hypothetical protein
MCHKPSSGEDEQIGPSGLHGLPLRLLVRSCTADDSDRCPFKLQGNQRILDIDEPENPSPYWVSCSLTHLLRDTLNIEAVEINEKRSLPLHRLRNANKTRKIAKLWGGSMDSGQSSRRHW